MANFTDISFYVNDSANLSFIITDSVNEWFKPRKNETVVEYENRVKLKFYESSFYFNGNGTYYG